VKSNENGAAFSRSALWASAMVILALILVRASRRMDSAAYGEMVSHAGDYVVMATDAGNEDLILVLDNRSERLSAYIVENQRIIQRYDVLELKKVFADARARALGRK